jgi:16S rRNA (guanine527-N7)-methyltransferase
VFHVKRAKTTEALLDAFVAHLTERAVPLGLISSKDVPRIRERHVEDSLRALACIPDPARALIDIGSGAGLPGIPIAIARPALVVTLVEPSRKRIAFLEYVVSDLGLPNVRVHAGRAQDLRAVADVVLVRAVADACSSWLLAEPLLGAAGVVVYFAGRSWTEDAAQEVAALGATPSLCATAGPGGGGPLVMMRRAAGCATPGGDGRDRG